MDLVLVVDTGRRLVAVELSQMDLIHLERNLVVERVVVLVIAYLEEMDQLVVVGAAEQVGVEH